MADLDHFDDNAIIVDGVDHAVDALPYPIQLATRQLFATRWTRVVPQRFDPVEKATNIGLWYSAKVFGDGRLEPKFRASHRL
jgi:hypothetical protein